MSNSQPSAVKSGNRLLGQDAPYVITVCFLAPAFWVNIWLGYVTAVYRLIGFTPHSFTFWIVRGCYTEIWVYPVTYFTSQLYFLTCVGVGFLFSWRGSRRGSTYWILAGAFMLYPIVDRFIWLLVRIKDDDELWFSDQRAIFEKQLLPLFGSFYTFKRVSFWIDNLIILSLIFVIYKVIFLYWNKNFRRQMLTWGAIASITGWICWYLILGPMVY